MVLFALLRPLGRAVADYLGPDRAYTVEETREERVRDPANDQWELTNGDQTCVINHPCDEHPSTERQESLCGWVADNAACTPAYRVETVTVTETRYHPEATISGEAVCSVPGENGWCRGGLSVRLEGSEPLSGYQIIAVEGTLDGVPFACGGAVCDVPVSEEGEHSLSYWALSDWGDSSRMGSSSVRLDSQPPEVMVEVSGTVGENGWYTSPTVGLRLSAEDATSGVAVAQIQADGGAWQTASEMQVSGEGQHSLAYRVRDEAGHEVGGVYAANIDLTPPSSVFTEPPEGSTVTVGETLVLRGRSQDGASGLAGVELSLDGGGEWQALSTDGSGNWVYRWDTTRVKNGRYSVQVRGRDLAGWQEDGGAHVTVVVKNEKPHTALPGQWYIWERIRPEVEAGATPVERVRLTITDREGRWAERVYEYGAAPGEFVWDRAFGDGVIAPPGSYVVTLGAWDEVGHYSRAEGEVVIPLPPTVTASPSATIEASTPTAEMNLSGGVGTGEAPGVQAATATSVGRGSDSGVEPDEASGGQAAIPTSPKAAIEPGRAANASAASNILWGGAALAFAGAATAYVLSRRRQRKAAERARRQQRRMVRGSRRAVYAADLTDEQVRAQIEAAGGDPNMDIEKARAIVHNARVAAARRAAAEPPQPENPPPPEGLLERLPPEDRRAAAAGEREPDPGGAPPWDSELARMGDTSRLEGKDSQPPAWVEELKQAGFAHYGATAPRQQPYVPADTNWKQADMAETARAVAAAQRKPWWQRHAVRLRSRQKVCWSAYCRKTGVQQRLRNENPTAAARRGHAD